VHLNKNEKLQKKISDDNNNEINNNDINEDKIIVLMMI
jgi:hypothetical protein